MECFRDRPSTVQRGRRHLRRPCVEHHPDRAHADAVGAVREALNLSPRAVSAVTAGSLSAEREIVEMLEGWAARLGTGIPWGAEGDGRRLLTQVHAKGVASRWGSAPSDTKWIERRPALAAHAKQLARLLRRGV